MAYRPDTGERVGLADGISFVLFPPLSWGSSGLQYPLTSSPFGPVYYVPRTVFLVASFLLNLVATPIGLVVTLVMMVIMLPLALLRDVIAPNLATSYPRLAVWPFAGPGIVLIWVVFVPVKAMNLLAFFWDWLFGPKIELV
jgi:hypothetical protein